MRYSRRDLIKHGAALSALATAAACSGGAPTGDAAASAAAQPMAPAPPPPFRLMVKVHGAFGLITNKATGGVSVAALADPGANNPCSYDYTMHQALLVVRPGEGVVGTATHASTTIAGATVWNLAGVVTFSGGAATGAVNPPERSPAADEFEPFAPANPYNDSAWNDLSYVPHLGTASSTWRSRTAAVVALPAGDLRVVGPPNHYARVGRWRWPGASATAHAYSDMVRLETTASGPITITSPAGTIELSPVKGRLIIEITTQVVQTAQVLRAGEPLTHLAMLYDLTGTPACSSRPVPTFELLTGRAPKAGGATPGVLCPMALLDE